MSHVFKVYLYGSYFFFFKTLVAFSWAVHKTIDQVKVGRSAEGADARIVTLTMSLKGIWAPAKKINH